MIDPIIAIILSYLETSELIQLCRSDMNYKLLTQKFIKEFELVDYYALITDDDISFLKGIRIINLFGCSQITDDCLKYLKDAHTIK
ncbi:MAG: hypothetical protein Harvfovirus3_38 [Harvfovirus sp.]|uniref:F-box domain-containing protein n=1 Tax=Harvfovirus sp. TaxID=2487768 RepID=A0A3G5A447_9VIRU|nr:MAG: hypothetical protein Harvfovirus3_38 [Harvfovirus sp.]